MTDGTTRYTGRFAPSPSGPLHFGSLVAALASFLDARAQGGHWRLRMEDLDPPREEPGAADAILRCLDAHHLHWDGDVLYQSSRHEVYRQTLRQLEPFTYRCTCSRLALQNEVVYGGHCRHRHHGLDVPAAVRLDVAAALRHLQLPALVAFDDLLQGRQQQNLLAQVGDFVIHRKDGLFAYQLAVVVDDIGQGITHVIRGADLLDSTPRQILLFRLLGATVPAFGHVPLVLDAEGQKLSKQNLAPALDDQQASDNLVRALRFLQQKPPADLCGESAGEILRWGIRHWQRAALASGHPPPGQPAPGHPVLGPPEGLE